MALDTLFQSFPPPTALNYKQAGASYTILNTDDVILGSCPIAPISLTLPASSLNAGKLYWIQKVDAAATGAVTIAASGGDLIVPGGNATYALYERNSGGPLYSNGAGWYFLAQMPVKQAITGTPQTSAGTTTSATFAAFSNSVTLSFTANRSGTYKVSGSFSTSHSGTNDSGLQIVATVGSPTVVFSQTAIVTGATGALQDSNVYTIVTLTAGTAYTFVLQGKTSGGTFTLASNLVANGHTLLAEEIS